ncbi:hypothetical protein PICMEDRAFT_13797 [Pichia membranifaciens NRRL Y-2026]|uniref:Uncharacterized protein n=1 Tax=Pichia membranifaciens NRRL Y-2026 TaxID=763406 RepID=A0A1E3NDQ9_9ASCO|nr:hypothetical protein PICMEDRAFT_13797 [Pichia membranifaciens NRRL Y-2026]ODQ44260.1 hypothetical protein PICMEDRAFT_13797 [Pichia membranifaciens NRRL Y-2026]
MSGLTLSSAWYSSQLATIFFAILAATAAFSAAYPLAYLSITVSLAISLYQALTAEAKSPAPAAVAGGDTPNAKSDSAADKDTATGSLKKLVGPARKHPTTPYVLLALGHLLVFPRFTLTLLPFVLFAFFHAINYTRTFVLPVLPVSEGLKSRGKSVLEHVNSRYNEAAFRLAVWVQLLCFAIEVLWAVVMTPLNLVGYGDGRLLLNWAAAAGWLVFIGTLQSQNLLMKAAINQVVTNVDGVVSDPRVPQQARDVWARTKHVVRYKDLNHVQ